MVVDDTIEGIHVRVVRLILVNHVTMIDISGVVSNSDLINHTHPYVTITLFITRFRVLNILFFKIGKLKVPEVLSYSCNLSVNDMM